MVLYSNLFAVYVDNKKVDYEIILKLTSSKLTSSIKSTNSLNKTSEFFKINNFTTNQIKFINTLFNEAKQNNFTIIIGYLK